MDFGSFFPFGSKWFSSIRKFTSLQKLFFSGGEKLQKETTNELLFREENGFGKLSKEHLVA